MLLTISSLLAGIDLTTVIVAIIAIVSGGSLNHLYKTHISKGKDERRDISASEQSFMNILQNRVVELEDKIDMLHDKIGVLIESNNKIVIKLTSENAALIERNQNLRAELEEMAHKLKNK